MRIEFTYKNDETEIFEDVSDFFETLNQYVLKFYKTKECKTIHIMQVKSFTKL